MGGNISNMTQALARPSGDFAHRTNVLVVSACILLAAGIFIIDVVSLPLGVAAGVAYVAVVLLSLCLPGWQYAIFFAGVVSILTILGFFVSEPTGIPWMVIANRLLALAAIWLTAIVGSWFVHASRRKSDDAFGKIVGYLNVGHDVTDQLEHEKALQKAEQEANRARNAKSRLVDTASNDLRHHFADSQFAKWHIAQSYNRTQSARNVCDAR